MNKKNDKFIPALKFQWLTPFFDFFLKWLMPELQFKRRLIEQAGIEKDYGILDIGCGTGTLTVMIKGLYPEAHVEVFRVLRPGGELHATDFGKPHNTLMYLISLIIRWFEEVAHNIKGLLPEMLDSAGFTRVEETARYNTAFGAVYLYRAVKS